MKQSRATARYAKSLLEISEEKGLVDDAYNDMLFVRSVCVLNKDFSNLLKTPIVKTDLKISIINEIFHNKVNPLTLSFLILITKKKREGLLSAITSSFIALYKNKKNIKEVTITTAVSLDQELRQEVLRYVKGTSNSNIELIEKVDPRLVGGAVIRMDDKQLDTSISSKLKSLKQEFSKNLYIQNY